MPSTPKTGQACRIRYVTVWPNRDLPAFAGPEEDQVVDTAPAGGAFCVLEEENGRFALRLGDRICWVDAAGCFVNLWEYLGDLCSYRITNSQESAYTVHGFAIPRITGLVTEGYEQVCQADGSYLVPLLYPTAKKLEQAARAALARGLRLKIYDSFRPYRTTRKIFELALNCMDRPLPDTTHTGRPRQELELPPPREGEEALTYGWLMTGSEYDLGCFLAGKASTHNFGIALDLTLERADTGEELEMQTPIHDLSHYSVVARNNENANLLRQILLGAGFVPLAEEWWHFQDNESREACGPLPLEEGITGEGWVKDANGFRYRLADGRFLAESEYRIGGKICRFNNSGYVME